MDKLTKFYHKTKTSISEKLLDALWNSGIFIQDDDDALVTPLISKTIFVYTKIYAKFYSYFMNIQLHGTTVTLSLDPSPNHKNIIPWCIAWIFITLIWGFGLSLYLILRQIFVPRLDIGILNICAFFGLGAAALGEWVISLIFLTSPQFFVAVNKLFSSEMNFCHKSSKFSRSNARLDKQGITCILSLVLIFLGSLMSIVAAYFQLDPLYFILKDFGFDRNTKNSLLRQFILISVRLFFNVLFTAEFCRFTIVISVFTILYLRKIDQLLVHIDKTGVTGFWVQGHGLQDACQRYKQVFLNVQVAQTAMAPVTLILTGLGQTGMITLCWLTVKSVNKFHPIFTIFFGFCCTGGILIIVMVFSQISQVTNLACVVLNRKIEECSELQRAGVVGLGKVKDWESILPIRFKCGNLFTFSKDACLGYLVLLKSNIVNAILGLEA